MNSEIEALLAATAYRAQTGVAGELVNAVLEGLSTSESTGSAAHVAAQVKTLADIAATTRTTNPPPSTAQSSSADAQGPSVGETIARTAAAVTGVGPLITGLLKLFGSSDPEPLPALEKYIRPTPVSVEAALTSEREYSGVRYSQGGAPQSLGVRGLSAGAQAQSIQVNIQAMDSQSFLDRQDDIARAVREAMLHSNSINDVVLEL
jgi:hypothetical protein